MIRFLIDANLSPRLVELLASRFPGCTHVQQLFPNGLDLQILDYAVANGYLVLTKDLDFIDLATFRGAPAKVVRIALGNCRTENVAALVMTEHEIISEFAGDPTALHLSLPGRRSQ